jgi:hypothetical protein
MSWQSIGDAARDITERLYLLQQVAAAATRADALDLIECFDAVSGREALIAELTDMLAEKPE